MIATPWGPLAGGRRARSFLFTPVFRRTRRAKGHALEVLGSAPRDGSYRPKTRHWPSLDSANWTATASSGALSSPACRATGIPLLRRCTASGPVLWLHDGESHAPGALAQAVAALAGGQLLALCFFPAMHRYSMQDERVARLCWSCSPPCATGCGVRALRRSDRRRSQRLGLPSLFDMRFSSPIDLHAWRCASRKLSSSCRISARDISVKRLCCAIYVRTYIWILPAPIAGYAMRSRHLIFARCFAALWMSWDRSAYCSAPILPIFRADGTPKCSKRSVKRCMRSA